MDSGPPVQADAAQTPQEEGEEYAIQKPPTPERRDGETIPKRQAAQQANPGDRKAKDYQKKEHDGPAETTNGEKRLQRSHQPDRDDFVEPKEAR